MSGGEIFIFITFLLPVYALLIYGYKYPEEGILLGKRWMYKERPEFNEDAILFHKKASLISIVVLTIILILIIFL